MKNCITIAFRAHLVLIAAFLTPSALHAQINWSGATSGAWLTDTNWTGNVTAGNATVTTNANIAGFINDTQATVGINMNTTSGVYYLGAIDRTTTNAARTINNSSTTVPGVLTLNGATVNSVANTIIRNTSTGLLTITNGTGSGTLGLALGNPTTNVIQITGNGGITINSVISGGGGITKQGTGGGSLTLAGNNNYTGVTAITDGAIAISNSNALGSSAAGANNTTISANGTSTSARLLISGGINSPENITLTGTTERSTYTGAIQNISGTNTLSGNITLAGVANAGAQGLKIQAEGGTLNLTGFITNTTTTHTFILQPRAATAAINVSNAIANNGGDLLLVGLSGTAGATVTLNGVSGSGIAGTTLAQQVTLRLGVTDALRTDRNLTLSYGGTTTGEDRATFDLRGFNQTVNALIGNVGTGASPSPNSDRLITNGVAGTSILTVGNGGVSGTFRGQINSGTGNIQLIKAGSGNQTLADQNSYTGGTRIDAGTLTLGHASNTLANTGAVNVNGGTLALGANSDTVGAVTLTSGSITSSTGVLTGASYSVQSGSVTAILGGSGIALTKSTGGTVTLTGNNTYTGATSVNAGTLAVNGAGSINGSTGITLNGGQLAYNSSVALTQPLTFTSGTLGGTAWTGSTLNNLTIGANRTISPGNSPGTASTVDQAWASGGNYTWEINNANGTVGTDPGWDLLSGTGNLTITSNSGTPFNILITSLTLGNVSGNATNFDDTLNYAWQIADFANPVSGFDVSDFLVNTSSFTNTFTGNFGIALGGTGSVPGDNTQVYITYVAVPEPAAIAILGAGVGLLGLAVARRRKA